MAEWPQFAPVPPPAILKMLQPEEWDGCLHAWATLTELRLAASDKSFKSLAPGDESALLFLCSFYRELQASSSQSNLRSLQEARTLQKLCFLLTRRFLLDLPISPSRLLQWSFLSDLCSCYPSSSALKRLLSETWSRKGNDETITSGLENAKSSIFKRTLPHEEMKESVNDSSIVADIRRLTILASVLPECGQILVTGSDWLDMSFDVYDMRQKDDALRSVLLANTYVGFISLLKGSRANLSLLLDQLFSLKAAVGVDRPITKKDQPTLLSDIVCSTDLLSRLERYLATCPQKRALDLVSSLRSYQAEYNHLHHRYQKHKKKVENGKNRAADTPIAGEFHVHRMALVTQVQDLFPDLGSAYIIRLFDFYGDSPETVIESLLENSLQPELQSLDKSEQLVSTHPVPHRDPLSPQPTPAELMSPDQPATTASVSRRNIFDEDVDIAELARSDDSQARSKLKFGRADPDVTADLILENRDNHGANKAAILSALASFDSDDDERDDTYDVADVGGTIDGVAAPGADTDADANADLQIRRRHAEEMDMSLFRAYKATPALFGRDTATRRSQSRASLKRETGMTDEAIEGWAVILNRDPKRLAKMEHTLLLSAGGGPSGAIEQPEIRRTAYRKGMEDSGDDSQGGSDDGDPGPSGPPFRSGRGRGQGGRGRSGGAHRGGAPPTSQNPTLSRQRKEENKSSRANHNRRQQRAKKIARGGGLPG